MNIDETMDSINDWIDDVIESNEEDGIKTCLRIEQYEHACMISFGSKKGDFPQIGSGGLDGKYHIITSGVLDGNTIIADPGAKKVFDFENMVWKFLCGTQMEGCEKGYEQTVNCPDGLYKIRVEKLEKCIKQIDDRLEPVEDSEEVS